MGRKRKKIKEKEGFKPETAKDPIDVESPEVVEAVEKFNTEQSEAKAELMDDAPDEGLPDPDRTKATDEDTPDETTSDEPAMSQEHDSQPEAKEHAEESEAKAEEQPPAESTEEAKADVPESDEQPKDEPEQKETRAEYLAGDSFDNYTVEVITEDGARAVPLSNLVTTYHKYPETQRKYNELKPVRDLAKKAQVEISQVLPLLELGIQTYARQAGIMSGSQPPVGSTGQSMTAQQPGQSGYYGPFKDEETDAYYKEADPELHSSMHMNFKMAHDAASRIQSLEQRMQQAKAEPPAPPAGPSEDEVMKAFDDKILTWAGSNDYFTAPNIGDVRLTGFKNFIMKNHAGKMKLSQLTPDFLSSEFVRFDPKYNLEFAKNLNEKKAKSAQNDSGMFAEGSDVRSKAVPLDEQQKHMADMY